MKVFLSLLCVSAFFLLVGCQPAERVSDIREIKTGPVRVLFLGHESEQHPSDLYFPMLQQALGRDAIYFDYVTSVEKALGNAEYLNRFDAVLLYANHKDITPNQWKNLKNYVEQGGGFVPVHCASWCFQNEPGFDQLVGGRFAKHKTGVFKVSTINPDHAAVKGVAELEAWDETYVHKNHNETGRTVLQVRNVAGPDDNISEPEPWTWVRTEGKGRVFYTASGHDERVWSRPEFHQLLKSGILWAVGENRRITYGTFISSRTPLTYEKRDNIPNYEKRPEPLPYQHPLSPEDSLSYTRVPVGFRLELFASEPDIINPICMAWDERGRLWVGEVVDYPNELTPSRRGRDSIKILEDTDGDGECDKVTVFASGLNIPTSIVFSRGGIIVAHAPDFLFLKDTDGDDVADVREVLNTGWGVRDTHAGPSNLHYGFDNKIWGTVGYSAFNGPDWHNEGYFAQGVFNMNPDGSDVTFLHQFNNNTWGLSFNESGDAFGSTANNNPAFFCGFPETGYQESKGRSAKMIADSASFHPITPNIRQVDVFGGYTAGAGYAFATSQNFPATWRNSMAFICGPTGNLLGMYQNIPDGSGYLARNRFSLVASADEWFSPVAAEVGPDGNLWIADWYNFIIQHNPTPTAVRGGYDAANGTGNAHVNPNRDRQHGRIYRLIWEGAKAPAIKSLAKASPKELVAALGNDGLFWRLTAQRLLVEQKPEGMVDTLSQMVRSGGLPAVHAFRTLQGLGKLDQALKQAALLNKDPMVRKAAASILGNSLEDRGLLIDTAILADSDLGVRRVAFTALAHQNRDSILQTLIRRLYKDSTNHEDSWLSIALKAAAVNQGISLEDSILGPNLVANGSFEEAANGVPLGWKLVDARNYGNSSVSLDPVPGKQEPRSGSRLFRMEADDSAEFTWTTQIAVEPETDYRLASWIEASALREGNGSFFSLKEIPEARSETLKWRASWQELEVFFNSGKHTQININLNYVGGNPFSGTVSFDDVSLCKVLNTDDSDMNVVGNAARGKTIFYEHELASCTRCHQVGGVGGVVGPSLDGIATRQAEDYIRESLVDPQAKIAEGFPIEVSPMPPFGVLLSTQELEDVIAYLKTLE
jgi:uncharacterized protein